MYVGKPCPPHLLNVYFLMLCYYVAARYPLAISRATTFCNISAIFELNWFHAKNAPFGHSCTIYYSCFYIFFGKEAQLVVGHVVFELLNAIEFVDCIFVL
jgi:hypothetical protein